MDKFNYYHTGKYDLATDSFVGGQVATFGFAGKEFPHREALLYADTPQELELKWRAAKTEHESCKHER